MKEEFSRTWGWCSNLVLGLEGWPHEQHFAVGFVQHVELDQERDCNEQQTNMDQSEVNRRVLLNKETHTGFKALGDIGCAGDKHPLLVRTEFDQPVRHFGCCSAAPGYCVTVLLAAVSHNKVTLLGPRFAQQRNSLLAPHLTKVPRSCIVCTYQKTDYNVNSYT